MNLDTMWDLMTSRCLTDRTLKKSFFSPARPWRAETRLSPGFVLGSSKSSTETRPSHHSAARTDVVLLIRRTVRPEGRPPVSTRLRPCLRNGASWRAEVGWVRCLNFLSILLDGSPVMACVQTSNFASAKIAFSNILRFGLDQGPSLVAEGKHAGADHDHREGKELAHGERCEDKANVSIRFAKKLY